MMLSKENSFGYSNSGFTLIEVLVALAIAALGFGVILHSLGLQLTTVATSVDRHQMLMSASQVLETSLADGKLIEDRSDVPLVPEKHSSRESEHIEIARFLYSLETSPVTADPRIQQVQTSVTNGRRRATLAAYRLKIRRE